MKKYFLSFVLIVAVLSTSLAQRTPQPSPAASVMQTVGVTDFTVVYSRPAAKGRTIFGGSGALVPYGELWRTGANAATTIESSTAFMFGGKRVPAGKYSLLSIPTGGAWTVILNKNTAAGTGNYKQEEDAARAVVYPTSSPFQESFLIHFTDVTDNSAKLNISWASVSVPITIEVMTDENTMANLEKTLAEKPNDAGVMQNAASFMLSRGKDLDRALALTDKAIGMKETYRNVWLKSQILSKMGKPVEALPLAQKALALGASSGDSSFGFYKAQIEKDVKDITAKLPAPPAPAPAAKGKPKK
jgi:hypothetical protein